MTSLKKSKKKCSVSFGELTELVEVFQLNTNSTIDITIITIINRIVNSFIKNFLLQPKIFLIVVKRLVGKMD